MYSKLPDLHRQLRNLITEDNHIQNKYIDADGKNKWNCICSAMDWLYVGIENYCEALKNISPSHDYSECMAFFQYISCISITWESIQQLHRVFVDDGKIPFHKERKCFVKRKYPELDDNEYFEEIRACFGEHSTNLHKRGISDKRFASFSRVDIANDGTICMRVYIYSNNQDVEMETIEIPIHELHDFFVRRVLYITDIIDKVELIKLEWTQSWKSKEIEFYDDWEARLNNLMSENDLRNGSDFYKEMLILIRNFLHTEFKCKENEDKVSNYRKSVFQALDYIQENLQNMSYEHDEKISEILDPIYRPDDGIFNYHFSKLRECVFESSRYLFDIEIITNCLNKYVTFEFNTIREFYWLVVIALNLAQADYKHIADEKRTDDTLHGFIAFPEIMEDN